MMIQIARGQAAKEEELVQRANGILILDTNLLSTVVWSERYFGHCDPRILEMAERELCDLYLLADIDIPWLPDGIRDSEQNREWMHNRFLSEIQNRNLPYVIVSGTSHMRMATAIKAIDSVSLAGR
jgi:nicotinamide riboside kinase